MIKLPWWKLLQNHTLIIMFLSLACLRPSFCAVLNLCIALVISMPLWCIVCSVWLCVAMCAVYCYVDAWVCCAHWCNVVRVCVRPPFTDFGCVLWLLCVYCDLCVCVWLVFVLMCVRALVCSGFVLTTCHAMCCECDVFERALVVYMCRMLVRLCTRVCVFVWSKCEYCELTWVKICKYLSPHPHRFCNGWMEDKTEERL
jgi:hypothetical protein